MTKRNKMSDGVDRNLESMRERLEIARKKHWIPFSFQEQEWLLDSLSRTRDVCRQFVELLEADRITHSEPIDRRAQHLWDKAEKETKELT